MTHYEDLISRLRNATRLPMLNALCREAADEIERLAMYEAAFERRASGDYISRDAATLEIQRYGVGCLDPDDFTPEQAERFVIGRINSIPAADVRPVVTCEKCKWRVDTGYHFCYKRGQRCPNDSDFFCAYGELLPCGAVMDEEIQK